MTQQKHSDYSIRLPWFGLPRLFPFMKPYKGIVLCMALLVLLNGIIDICLPLFQQYAINNFIAKGTLSGLGRFITLYVCVIAVQIASSMIDAYQASQIEMYVGRDLKRASFNHLQTLSFSYFNQNSVGYIHARVMSDTNRIGSIVAWGLMDTVWNLSYLVGVIVVMFVINYIVALVVVVLTPLSLFVAAFITKRTFKSFSRQVKVQGKLAAHVKEMLGGQKAVILFNQEEKSCKKFAEIDAHLYQIGWRAQYFSALTNPSTRFVNAVIYAFVGVLGAVFCILSDGGTLHLGAFELSGFTVGMLSVFLSYANQYTKPFNEVSNVVTQLQNAFASAARVFEVTDEPGEDLSGSARIGKVRGEIRIEHARFSYDPAKPLIEDLNVSVPAGSKVAIVGPTGCGKTTLINLLMRFYDLQGGRITVDGTDITSIPLDEYRKLFGMVLQESFLAGETVAWNIAYGNEAATRAQVEAAAKAAYCDFFIRNLEHGYDTVLSGNVSISQGERQLLCIARVMLADPPMLILDEATSNIDTMTEMRIQKAFRKIMRGRTSFIVAHRLSTILDADLILVMNEGTVIEQGTHESLMARRGFYYDLYNSQFAQ